MTALRAATVTRTTKETDVRVELALDGSGRSAADTGMPFFDHMLQQLGKHAGWDLDIACKGDLQVDGHHTVEDCGLAIGQALTEALVAIDGVTVYPSDANFVLFVPPAGYDATQVWQDLLDRGVLVRDLSAVVPNALRVTAGAEHEVGLFLTSLREMFAS